MAPLENSRFDWLFAKPVLLPLIGFIALFAVGIDLRPEISFWRPASDAAHFGLFIAAVWYACRLARRGALGPLRRRRLLWLAAGLTVAIELLQPLVGRSASIVDIRNGLLGVVAGALIEQIFATRRTAAKAAVLSAAALVQLALLYPAYRAYQAISWRNRSLPLIADFEAEYEDLLWEPIGNDSLIKESVEVSEKLFYSGQHSLRVETTGRGWSGVKYYAGYTDWSRYRALQLAVYNESKGLQDILFRIDDDRDTTDYDNRFNAKRTLAPGWNLITIEIDDIRRGPKTRPLDVQKIYRLLIFAGERDAVRIFYVDAVRLLEP